MLKPSFLNQYEQKLIGVSLFGEFWRPSYIMLIVLPNLLESGSDLDDMDREGRIILSLSSCAPANCSSWAIISIICA